MTADLNLAPLNNPADCFTAYHNPVDCFTAYHNPPDCGWIAQNLASLDYPADRTEHTATVALPGTCGELVQGTLDDIPCLVSCPIEFYSVAQVCLHSSPGWQMPPDAPKADAALRAGQVFLEETGHGGHLRLRTALPRGRGYGSSTADIGAALYALAESLGKALAPDQAAQLAIGVEPSDSTLFPGLALLDHRGGRFHERLGPAPRISVLVIDPGGEVDTLAFNRLNHREALRRLAPDHREAFDLLRQGLRAGDLDAVGQAATLSACAHQAILFNPLLDQVLMLAQTVGALGVCRAHSGTLLGLLLDPRYTDLPALAAFVAGCLPSSVTVSRYAMVDGGPCYQPTREALK